MAPADGVSANQLVGEYVAACGDRPSSDVIGHLGRIAEKLPARASRQSTSAPGWRTSRPTPSTSIMLTSMVNEATIALWQVGAAGVPV
ncbi:hypothetical protein ACFWN1_33175 [Streptomyces sp. NPDC058459]|uniref:hypothetical protein n=1 Tax=Streptomyces sp. NPDC058459 TaxID=3346508 RepID=UPI00365E5332